MKRYKFHIIRPTSCLFALDSEFKSILMDLLVGSLLHGVIISSFVACVLYLR